MLTSAARRATTFSRRISSKMVPSLARHKHTLAAATLASNTSSDSQRYGAFLAASGAAVLALATAAAVKTTECEDHLTPADVGKEDFEEVQASHDISKMPEYSSDDVAQNDGEDGKPIWMSYGGVVYDVTNFIPNHPGGSEKIMTAAGSVCYLNQLCFL